MWVEFVGSRLCSKRFFGARDPRFDPRRLNVCCDFPPIVKLKLQIPVKRSTGRGRGLKGAPSASTDDTSVTVSTYPR